ncbi:MAG TPA: T9SS type A sorting domain-containing protein [Bacteroidales bacterium]|nr:T9SS type A sorting domain-containing protein [Bacteroidales bacterium]
MKKIILLTFGLLILFFNGSAQNLTLSKNSNSVANGDTLTFTGGLTTTIAAIVDVKNNSADTLSVKCKRTHIDVIHESENSICWGGSCWPITESVTPDPTIMNPGATSSEFSGDYKANGVAGISIIRYTFFNISDANDTVCFIAKFVSLADFGLNETSNSLMIGGVYPNPADKACFIDYILPVAENNAKIIITDMVGNEVKIIPVKEKEGKMRIATYDMPEGVYFYSFIINNKAHYTKKLVVAHQ